MKNSTIEQDNFEWLNETNLQNYFNIKMSEASHQLLNDQTMSTYGDDIIDSTADSVINPDIVEATDAENPILWVLWDETTDSVINPDIFEATDAENPILWTLWDETLPLDKMHDIVADFDGGNFSVVLSEVQQHLAFLNVSDTDFAAAAHLLESGFSTRPDHFALLHG